MNGVCDSCGATAEVNDEKLCTDCVGENMDDEKSDANDMDMGEMSDGTDDDM